MRARWMFLVFLALPGMLSAARTARLAEPKGTIADTSPTFTWTVVDAATQYDLWVVGRDGPQIAESITAAGCAGETCSFAVKEPLAPGPYLWLVLSRVPGNIDRWSSPRRFTIRPDGARPAKVELVSPSGEVDTTTPTFTWKPAAAGEVSYELRVVGSKPRTYFSEIYSGGAICTDVLCTAPPALTNLTLGDGKYSFTVRASNVVGRGPRSDSMRFDVRTLPLPPERPALVAPRGRTPETSPLYVWSKVERASEYYLEIRRDGAVVHAEWYAADPTLCPDTMCAVAPMGLVLDYGRYHFRVMGKNAGGTGRRSRSMNFRVGDYLERPIGIGPESTAGIAPTFQWYPVPNATYYVLRVRQERARIATMRIDAATSCDAAMCSAALGFNLAESSYRWSVIARAEERRSSSPSDWMYFDAKAGEATPPRVPDSLQPTDVIKTKTPDFVWTHVPNATSYKLTVKDAFDPVLYSHTYTIDEASCSAVEGCRVTPAELLANGDYTFMVEAINSAGSSQPSSPRRFKVDIGVTPPGVPTIIGPAGTIKSSTPTFSWSPVATATSYVLSVKNAQDPVVYSYEYGTDVCAATCAVTPVDVLSNGPYTLFVTAKKGDVAGAPAEGRFTVDKDMPPGVPVIVSPAGTIKSSTPTFSWNPVATATSYMLTVKNAADPVVYSYEFGTELCAAACTVTPVDVLSNGPYTLFVTAKKGDVAGAPAEGRFTVDKDTPPGVPVIVSPAGKVEVTTPTFSWNPVAKATSYVLTVKNAADPLVYSYEYGADVCAATCAVTPADVLANGDYTFLVTAKQGDVAGAPGEGKFTVEKNAPPETPVIVGPAGTVKSSTPTFSWNPVATATSYVLTVNDAAGALVYSYEYGTDACTPTCAVTPPDTLVDADYTFSVTAKKGDVAGTPAAGTFTVDTSVSPGASTPLSPSGAIGERNPAFTWTFVEDAVAYTLVIVDDVEAAEIHRVRYLVADLTCDATQCTVTPDPALDLADGTYSFSIITENAGGMTTTSSVLPFNVSTAPSTVRVTSHTDGETLSDGGVLISGTVDSATVSLTAELSIGSSTVMAARPVEISPNNAWSVFLLPGQLSPGAAVLTLVGTDSGGGTSTLAFNFTVAAFDLKESMLLTRATFGATPDLLAEIKSSGVTAFQDRLLNPVPDPGFDAFVSSLPTSSESEVREYGLMHAILNPNALQEVMTQFWDNHFSTDMDSHDVAEFELRENNNFRANAFGRFRDLLEISAKSPAMLIYLDATNNVVGDPNENYAREILELSTLGVNGGYTQNDIEELARILTGWKEIGGNFAFVNSDHDQGTKRFLGVTFPTASGPGLAEGEDVLDMLSAHRSTAQYLCTKLIEVFVSESPRAGLVSGCADVFQSEHLNGNPNQMRDVVQFILDSPDFVDPVNFHAKVKTPLELLASTVRHLDATVEDRRDLERDLDRDLDMELFGKRSPDGFSETGDDWIDTSLMLARVNFVNEVARETRALDTYVDIRAYFQDKGFETAEGVVGYLFEIALQNEFTDLELSIAYDILSARGTSQFDINAGDAEARLRQLVGTIFSFPGFQHQ